MKKLIALTAALAAIGILFSCEKKEAEVTPELSVSPLTADFEAAGGNKDVTVTSNTNWTASASKDWVTVSPDKGSNNGTVKITAAANETLELREAEVTIAAGDLKKVVKVAQQGVAPALTVSPASIEAEAAGKEETLTITANLDWTVTIHADADWVTADKTSGSKSGSVKLTIAAAPTIEARNTIVTVAGGELKQEIAISQKGQDPVLNIDKAEVPAEAAGGSYEIAVTSNTSWKVALPEDAAWLEADKAEGEGDGKVTITVNANNLVKARNAVVSFTSGELKKDAAVAQAGLTPSADVDALALLAIYNASDGANWKESRRWTDLTKPISEWTGIKVNEDGRVIELNITNGTVPSTSELWEIPEELMNLTELKVLQIVGSRVKGEIPEFLYDMTTLTNIRLNTNPDLAGPISPKIGQLTNLADLYLNGDGLTGSLPAEIGQLKKLVNLNLAQTSISGALPPEIGDCESLAGFYCWKTGLSGEIPDVWDKLTHLGILQLNQNPGLIGPLPKSLGKATTTATNYSIWFHECNLTGNIPVEWKDLPSVCKQLRVQKNQLDGVVPAEVQAHPNYTAKWEPATYIYPQQDGHGLSAE